MISKTSSCGYPSNEKVYFLSSSPIDLATSDASLGVDEERRQNERGERQWRIVRMRAMMRSMRSGAERNNFALDCEPRPRVSYWLLPLEIDVLGGAKVAGERHAIEQFAHLTLVHRYVVEESEQQSEQAHDQDHADPDQQDLPSTIVMAERDERHQRVGRQEAEDKAEQMRIVVYPWQDAQCQQP